MIYNHIVVHNGKYYAAGEDVPDKEENVKMGTETVTETKAEGNVPLPLNNTKYTKTEINRMTTAELQDLAKGYGINNAFEKSGSKLKKTLIELFEL